MPLPQTITITSLADLAALGHDDIIDVRAPAEYAEDHLPGAINLPVLDDEERARVGTIYKQVSPFSARKIGAALVARNAAAHLMGPLAEKPGGWRPLVYCWRGGQRSGSFATILGQIGWRVATVAGGYKAWRALISKALYETPFPAPLVLLDGNTGSAKTEVLNLLPARGLQVIDLEGLARHRGSIFGAMAAGQPAQKGFETALAMQIAALDPLRPVVVEAESSRVGECRLPPQLWKAMRSAPRVAIAAPLPARSAYLTRAYADVTADPGRLQALIAALGALHSAKDIAAWQGMAEAGAFAPLAEGLMAAHYDPRYEKHRARIETPLSEVEAECLAPQSLGALADRVAGAVMRLSEARA